MFKPDRFSLCHGCAAIGRFHDSRAASCDDREVVFGELARDGRGGLVIAVGRF